jgi:hypothetical protein
MAAAGGLSSWQPTMSGEGQLTTTDKIPGKISKLK